MECESNSKPKWAVDHGLQLCGQYYEGFVDDYEAVLNSHMIETVTSYGVRRSRQAASSTLHKFIFDDKENIEDNLNLDTSSSTKEVCWIDQSTKKYSLYMKNFVNEKKRLCNSQSTCMSRKFSNIFHCK